MPILKLDHSDEKREVVFEVAYLRSLTMRQRFQMMAKKSEELRCLLKGHGYRKTAAIVKRT